MKHSFLSSAPNYIAHADYAYAEYRAPTTAAGGRKEGDQEALVTPVIHTSGPACLSYVYYMFQDDAAQGSFCEYDE